MAETYNRVAGQLASSTTTIYTTPGSTTAISHCLLLYNTGATNEVVNINLHDSGGSSRQYAKLTLEASGWAEVFLRATLETGDLVKADTTTATTVNYWLSNVEIT